MSPGGASDGLAARWHQGGGSWRMPSTPERNLIEIQSQNSNLEIVSVLFFGGGGGGGGRRFLEAVAWTVFRFYIIYIFIYLNNSWLLGS